MRFSAAFEDNLNLNATRFLEFKKNLNLNATLLQEFKQNLNLNSFEISHCFHLYFRPLGVPFRSVYEGL